MIKIKKAIIAGATGLIGRELVNILTNKGIEVLAVVRPNSPNFNLLKNNALLSIVENDINHLEELKDKVSAVYDVFFHLAWQGVYGSARDDGFLQCADIGNTLTAVKIAKALGCKKFIGAGSQAEVGIVNEKIGSNTIANPQTFYGIAKNTALNMSKLLAEKEGIEFNWGRILSVYGANDAPYTMVMTMLKKMLEGQVCDLSSGEQIWDFLYSTDAAQAFYHIAKYGKNKKVYPVGSGIGKPLKEYILKMYEIVDNKKATLNFGAIAFNSQSIKYLCADMTDIEKDTGFKPKVTFEEGIKKTIASLKN